MIGLVEMSSRHRVFLSGGTSRRPNFRKKLARRARTRLLIIKVNPATTLRPMIHSDTNAAAIRGIAALLPATLATVHVSGATDGGEFAHKCPSNFDGGIAAVALGPQGSRYRAERVWVLAVADYLFDS